QRGLFLVSVRSLLFCLGESSQKQTLLKLYTLGPVPGARWNMILCELFTSPSTVRLAEATRRPYHILGLMGLPAMFCARVRK
ncbi:hypothetical protein SAMN05421799_1151, partial [Alicyclobacillus vulcanalis]